MALYTLKSQQDVANMLNAPRYNPNSQTLYNALGRDAGQQAAQGTNDNFFVKRGKSIGNALGTTGAAVASGLKSGGVLFRGTENIATENLLKDTKTRMNDVAKKFGYNSWNDWQDAYEQARNAGDQAAIKRFEEQNKSFQAQANENAAKANKKAADYKDYTDNNYVSQKINQDNSKFLGSAINTLSTAADITGLSSTPLTNAIQGGVEGIADELEQNGGNIDLTRPFSQGIKVTGGENFDWGRAGQNALVGATTGAVTGALNKGISGAMAKRAAAKGVTNAAVKGGVGNAIKQGAKTIGTGAVRGALSGAVGGATGAGLQSALNRVDFGQGVQNALQGAVQGAQQGAVTGGIMAGANMAISKTPGVGKFYNQLQNAKTNWDQSGSNFDERLTNTLTSGDSAVGDWLMNKRQSNVLGAVGNLGNRVQDVNRQAKMPGLGAFESKMDNPGLSRKDYDKIAQEAGYKNFEEAFADYADGREVQRELLGLDHTSSNNYRLEDPMSLAKWLDRKNASNIIDAINNGDVSSGEIEGMIRGSGYNDPQEFLNYLTDRNFHNDALKTRALLTGDQNYIDAVKNIEEKPAREQLKIIQKYGDAPIRQTPTTASLARGAGYNNEAEAWEAYAKYKNDLAAEEYQNRLNSYNAAVEAKNGDFSYNNKTGRIIDVENKYIPPKYSTEELNEWLLSNQQAQTPTTAKGWAKKAGQRIVEDANNKGVGLSIKDLSPLDDIRLQQAYKDGAWKNLSPLDDIRLQNAIQTKGINNLSPLEDIRLQQALNSNSNQMSDDIRNMQIRDYNAYADGVDDTQAPQATMQTQAVQPIATAQTAQVNPWDRVAQEAGYSNYDEVLQRYAEANPNAKINPRGMAGQVLSWMDQNPNTPTTASGWAKRAGQRLVEDANNSSLGLRVRDVSQDEPSRRLYNALAGKQEPAVTETETFTEDNVVPSRTSKEGKLRYARGKELLRQYGTVDQPMARASRAVESVQEIADAGFTKPEDVERMANVITGSNGEVSKLTRNLINSAKPVDTFTGENGQTLEEFVDNSIQLNSLYGTNKGNAVKQTIEANLRSLPSRAEGSVTYTDAPDKVFKVIQNLEASAAELEGRGGSKYTRPSIENIHQAAVLKDTASLLKQRLFDGADVSEALTPEVAQNLKSYDPKNEKYANWVDNTIMNAKSIDDLRAAQAPFVRMSKYIDNAYTQAATVGGRMAENANDLSRILTTRNGLLRAGIDALWNSNTARRGRAAVYDKLADKAANNPTTAAGWAKQAGQRAAEDLGNTNLGNRIQDVSGGTTNTPNEFWKFMTTPDGNPSTRLYNAIGRTEGALAQETPAQNLANAAQEAEIVPSAEAGYVQPLGATTSYGANTLERQSNPTSTSLYNTVYGTTGQIPTYSSLEEEKQVYFFPPTGDYWSDMISRAMRRAKDAEDYTAMDSLYAMYQNAQSGQQKSSNVSSWSSSDRSKLLSAQNALDQIDQLENAYYQATGEGGSNAVQGWLRSRASDISGGNWDPSASNYNNLAESIGMSIIKNLINLGVTESDAERYKKYIPSITDTKIQAATKLETLRNIYQNQIDNLYSVYGA